LSVSLLKFDIPFVRLLISLQVTGY